MKLFFLAGACAARGTDGPVPAPDAAPPASGATILAARPSPPDGGSAPLTVSGERTFEDLKVLLLLSSMGMLR